MKAFLSKYMSWASLKDDVAKIYMTEFTESELNELMKFYQSPLEKKAIQKMPALMAKGAEMGQKRMQEHLPELRAAIAGMDQVAEAAPRAGDDNQGDRRLSAALPEKGKELKQEESRQQAQEGLADVPVFGGYLKVPWGSSEDFVKRVMAAGLIAERIEVTEDQERAVRGLEFPPTYIDIRFAEERKQTDFLFFDGRLAVVLLRLERGEKEPSILPVLEKKYGTLSKNYDEMFGDERATAEGAQQWGASLGIQFQMKRVSYSAESSIGGVRALGLETDQLPPAGVDKLDSATATWMKENARKGSGTVIRVVIYWSKEFQKITHQRNLERQQKQRNAAKQEKKERDKALENDL